MVFEKNTHTGEIDMCHYTHLTPFERMDLQSKCNSSSTTKLK